jgi:hypothetical protein
VRSSRRAGLPRICAAGYCAYLRALQRWARTLRDSDPDFAQVTLETLEIFLFNCGGRTP